MAASATNINDIIDKTKRLTLGQPSTATTLGYTATSAVTTGTVVATATTAATGVTAVAQPSNAMNIKSSDDLQQTILRLQKEYNVYAKETIKSFVPPDTKISLVETPERTEVSIDVIHGGEHYQFESIKAEHIAFVSEKIDSVKTVKAKFADGKTRDPKQTADRNQALRERFEKDNAGKPKNPNLYLYSGFLVKNAGNPIGFVVLGGGDKKGTAEMAYQNTVESWSTIPPEIVKEHSGGYGKKYKGVATMEVGTMVAYGRYLKTNGFKVNGENLEAIVATARADNPGSWKALAKNGLQVEGLDINPNFGPELRYQTKITL